MPIRESSCCHSSVWNSGFYSREDSLQPFHYLAAHNWAPLQTEVKRTAWDSSLGVFIHCRWDHHAEKLNMNGAGLGRLLKESGISGRPMNKSHERDSKGKVLLLRGKKNPWDLKIHFLFKSEVFSPLSREEVNHSEPYPRFLDSASPSQSPEMQSPATVVGRRMRVYTTTLPYSPILSKDTLQFSRFSSKHDFCSKKFFKIPLRYILKVKYPRRIF